MKEFAASKGGRRLSLEDMEYLQEFASSWSKIFSQYGNFVIDGCEPTYNSSANSTTITPGYMFIDGRICAYTGGTVTGKTFSFGVSVAQENAEYADSTVNIVRKIYTATIQTTDLSKSQIHYLHETGEFSYPTFASTVLQEGAYLEKGGDDPSEVVDLYAVLKATAYMFSGSNARIKAGSDHIFICPSYSENSSNRGLIIKSDGSITLTNGYPSVTTAGKQLVSNFGEVHCDTLVPSDYTGALNRDTNGRAVSSNGTFNLCGTVYMNGVKVATEAYVTEHHPTFGQLESDNIAVRNTNCNVDITINSITNMCTINGYLSPLSGYAVGSIFDIQPTTLDSFTPNNPEAVYLPLYDLDSMDVVGYGQVRNDAIHLVFTKATTSVKGLTFSGTYLLPANA